MSFREIFMVLVVVISILSGVFYFSSDSIAKYFWQKYQIADAALALDKSDADLAMQIGSYYFNGGTYDWDGKSSEIMV